MVIEPKLQNMILERIKWGLNPKDDLCILKIELGQFLYIKVQQNLVISKNFKSQYLSDILRYWPDYLHVIITFTWGLTAHLHSFPGAVKMTPPPRIWFRIWNFTFDRVKHNLLHSIHFLETKFLSGKPIDWDHKFRL